MGSRINYDNRKAGFRARQDKLLELKTDHHLQRRIWGETGREAEGGGRAPPPPPSYFFWNYLVFCNHFEELQTVLFQVELIFNNKHLTCVYPNTIETYFTPYHLLFGRQLLHSSDTTSAIVKNLTVLSGTTNKISHISNHFFG